jgi:hypothetical protein
LRHFVSHSTALTEGYQRAFQISAVITLVALALTFLVPKLAGRASSANLTVSAE